MASSFTTLGIEKMATGENAGTWGDKTNTNLDIVNTAISGYVEQAVTSGGTTALSITDGAATSTAQNAVIKLTGTISGNSIVTVPDSVEKVYIVTNGTSGAYTVQFKTASGTGITFGISEKTTKLVYSDGTNISSGPITKGYYTIPAAYTAVNGDQLLVNTSGSGIGTGVTITLPASPAIGNEVHFIDSGNAFASNNLTIGRNSSNILGAASNLVVSANGASFTLVYVNATRGWIYKDNI